MGKNILANHEILVPQLELTKPQPERQEICDRYHIIYHMILYYICMGTLLGYSLISLFWYLIPNMVKVLDLFSVLYLTHRLMARLHGMALCLHDITLMSFRVIPLEMLLLLQTCGVSNYSCLYIYLWRKAHKDISTKLVALPC